MSNTAPIKWAQRADSLYITIALPDVKDEKIVLTDTDLKFNGKSDGKDYEVNIKFFKTVDSKGSTYKVLPRSIQMLVMKGKPEEKDEAEEEEEEFWPRLLEDKVLEKNQVKIDWDRYVDEDEEEEGFDTSAVDGGQQFAPGMGGGGMPGMEGMDMEALMKQMGGMGGGDMNGAPPMDEADSDDDDESDLPELEETTPPPAVP